MPLVHPRAGFNRHMDGKAYTLMRIAALLDDAHMKGIALNLEWLPPLGIPSWMQTNF